MDPDNITPHTLQSLVWAHWLAIFRLLEPVESFKQPSPRNFPCWRARWCQPIAAMALLFVWASASATQYLHDAAGRLIEVIAPDGTTTAYQYDAAGNVVAIQRLATGQLAVLALDPTQGTAGTQVIVEGSGFSTTPSSNTVKFNGTVATVTSATTTQLVTTVPAGATTGPVSVTVGTITANSPQSFVVLVPPSITTFSPALVDPGATVTISGNNLNPVPGGTSVSVNGFQYPVSSITSIQAVVTVPTNGISGPLQVTTPYGFATSTTTLTVAPTSIGAANIASLAAVTAGGTSQTLNVSQAGKYGVFTFNANAGQYLSLQLSSLVTTPSGSSLGYTIYSPTNATLATGAVSVAASMSIHVPQILTTGTYLIAFNLNGSTFQMTATLEQNLALLNGSTVPISTAVGAQSKRMTFSGTAGQNVGLGLTGLTLNPSSPITAYMYVYGPTGTQVGYNYCYPSPTSPGGGCNISMLNLPSTGTYSVKVMPSGQQTMSFSFTASQNVGGTLALNAPQGVTLVPGQDTALTFTATAGQTVAVGATSIVTTPASQNVTLTVYNASGTSVGTASGATGSVTVNLTSLAAGTYTVVIVPSYAASATMQVMIH